MRFKKNPKTTSYYYFSNGFSFPVQYCFGVITLRIYQSYLKDPAIASANLTFPPKFQEEETIHYFSLPKSPRIQPSQSEKVVVL